MPSRRRILAPFLAFGLALPLAFAAGEPLPDPGGFHAASRLSRGEGVSVAVVGTDESLLAIVRRLAPACRASFVAIAPPATERPARRRPGADPEDDALARG